MHSPHNWTPRRIARFAIVVALALLSISAFKLYRVRAAEEAAQFAPTKAQRVILPAGTVIQGSVKHKFAAFSAVGDSVTAFVSSPLVFDGRLVIPDGAQIKGKLEKFSLFRETARATVNFNILVIDGKTFAISARPVVLTAPVQNDMEVLGAALKALAGGSLGTAVGAATGDRRALNRGLLEGARASVAADFLVPVPIILTRPLPV